MASDESRRAQALVLAEQLLGEIELSAIAPIDIARKASRLARLLDDTEAMQWLHFEVSGYPRPFSEEAFAAAVRSNRQIRRDPVAGNPTYAVQTLGEFSIEVEAGKAQLAAASDAPVSVSSSNPNQFVAPPTGNAIERRDIRIHIASQQALIDAIVGSMHDYVAERYQELRFGSSVETAFEVVRRGVDSTIGDLVPAALPMLSAAFENATSSNPEHWANAAGTCRRLLKAVADALRPPGPDVDGRKMGDGNYINRLVDLIASRSTSETATDVVSSELAYLGDRLDAADDAGHKGAHATVDRFEASRFITGTYLVLGDILRITEGDVAPVTMDESQPAAEENTAGSAD